MKVPHDAREQQRVKQRRAVQDVAAWLLLHHAATSSSSAADIIAGGAATTCLQWMQEPTVPSANRSAAATLLKELCKVEEEQEALLRLRQGGKPCGVVLMTLVLNSAADRSVRISAGGALVQLTATRELAEVCAHATPR